MVANLWAVGGTHVAQCVGTLLVIHKWYMLPKGTLIFENIYVQVLLFIQIHNFADNFLQNASK